MASRVGADSRTLLPALHPATAATTSSTRRHALRDARREQEKASWEAVAVAVAREDGRTHLTRPVGVCVVLGWSAQSQYVCCAERKWKPGGGKRGKEGKRQLDAGAAYPFLVEQQRGVQQGSSSPAERDKCASAAASDCLFCLVQKASIECALRCADAAAASQCEGLRGPGSGCVVGVQGGGIGAASASARAGGRGAGSR